MKKRCSKLKYRSLIDVELYAGDSEDMYITWLWVIVGLFFGYESLILNENVEGEWCPWARYAAKSFLFFAQYLNSAYDLRLFCSKQFSAALDVGSGVQVYAIISILLFCLFRKPFMNTRMQVISC